MNFIFILQLSIQKHERRQTVCVKYKRQSQLDLPPHPYHLDRPINMSQVNRSTNGSQVDRPVMSQLDRRTNQSRLKLSAIVVFQWIQEQLMLSMYQLLIKALRRSFAGRGSKKRWTLKWERKWELWSGTQVVSKKLSSCIVKGNIVGKAKCTLWNELIYYVCRGVVAFRDRGKNPKNYEEWRSTGFERKTWKECFIVGTDHTFWSKLSLY